MIKIWIDFKIGFMRFRGWPGGLESRGAINAKDVRKSDVVRLLPQFLATTWPFEVQLKTGE